jgi:hypothetical protein
MNTTAPKYRERRCNECGEAYTPRRVDEFYCSTPCRKSFENRRMVRGKELYDLFMVMRYDRGAAKLLGVWNLMCRLALHWREEDDRDRAGRKSWLSPNRALANKTYLTATRVAWDRTGKRSSE